jgi:hypothetical protein
VRLGDRTDVIELTPASVAIWSLKECLRHLEKSRDEPEWMMHAAASAHRAIQAALIAALAGSANIGASPPKLRAQWLKWYDESRETRPATTPDWRVMPLRELFDEAKSKRLPWSSGPLETSPGEDECVDRLRLYRDSFEHPKQLTFLLTCREVAEVIAGSISIAIRALSTLQHQIWEDLPGAQSLTDEVLSLASILAQDPGR